MASIQYKDLPEEIQALFLKRAQELNLAHNIRPFVSVTGVFTFSATEEGHAFWRKIADGKFSEFYERYPKNTDKIELISKEPIIYKGIVDNRKVKITIEYED